MLGSTTRETSIIAHPFVRMTAWEANVPSIVTINPVTAPTSKVIPIPFCVFPQPCERNELFITILKIQPNLHLKDKSVL